MRHIPGIISICLLALLFACCGKTPVENKPVDNSITVNAKKALTGTFLTLFDKQDWPQQQWDDHFQEMKDIGMNTVVIQFAAYGKITWFDSGNTFTTEKNKYTLSRVLNAGKNKNMDVYIGLYFDETYWGNLNNVEWLKLHADRCKQIAAEINSQFGSHPAFKGWYIPHEPEPDAYKTKELMDSFRDNLLNRISNYLHTLNNKPVSIAAYFNSELTTPEQLGTFMNWLGQCNLQVVMLQDGVGVNHVSLADVGKYYQAADKGLFEQTPAFTGEFWTDLETFSFAPQGPVTIDRIKSQLKSEMAVPHISKAVSFQYHSDMCPTGPGGSAASALRKAYLEFIKSL